MEVPDTAWVAAAGAILTALVGWYTARNARKGERESAGVKLIDSAVGLATGVRAQLDAAHVDLERERKERQQAQRTASKLREEVRELARRIETLEQKLEDARVREEALRVEMTALLTELRTYRSSERNSETRTRWDDEDYGGES